jgi:hypothetical protein
MMFILAPICPQRISLFQFIDGILTIHEGCTYTVPHVKVTVQINKVRAKRGVPLDGAFPVHIP